LEPAGSVLVDGALWDARTAGETVEVGAEIIVAGRDRHTLIVRPRPQPGGPPGGQGSPP
jgi:membrane-bound ClpP family serine protease